MKNNNKNNNIDKNKINMAKSISKALTGEKSDTKDQNISPELMKKVSDILNDENKIKKILESDDAQALIKKLGGD